MSKPHRCALPLHAGHPHALAAVMLLLAAAEGLNERAFAQEQQPDAKVRQSDFLLTPTPHRVVARMLDLGGAGPSDLVADLGSGDGRIPIAAARDYGAQAFGVEIDSLLLARARAEALAAGVASRVTFRNEDLFETDLTNVTLLTVYLLPSMNLRLRPRILRQMQPGARVVSHEFGFGAWLPDSTEVVEGRTLRLWVVPARAQGRWRVAAPGGSFSMHISQVFQEIEGIADFGGATTPLLEARLKGREIAFALDVPGAGRRHFSGRVESDAMAAIPGTGTIAGWHARRH